MANFRWHWLEMALLSECRLLSFFDHEVFSNSDDMVIYLPIRKSHLIIYLIKRTSQRVYRVMKYDSIAKVVDYNSFDCMDNIVDYFNFEFDLLSNLHFEHMQKNYDKMYKDKRRRF